MRFLLALFTIGLLLLGISASASAMPMHYPVAQPAGVTVNGDNWARDKYAAAAAAAGTAPVPVGDNWTRDKHAAAAAGETQSVTAPMPDTTTPWVFYALVSAALLIGIGVLATRMHRVHLPHGA